MLTSPLSLPWRFFILVALLLGGMVFGYICGVSRESDRRDARDLHIAQANFTAITRALKSGHRAAMEVIEWQKKSHVYYRNWQERLNHVPDNQLADCTLSTGVTPDAQIVPPANTVLLSGTFIRLYNAAWLPTGLDTGDTGGAADQIGAADTVTPRDILANTKDNAELCGDDRKRLDTLIDYLQEMDTKQ